MDLEKKRTLYVGNLDAAVTEEVLCKLFARIGPVKSSKIIRESASKPYAFLEFDSHSVAVTAMATMNGRLFLDKEMRVNWAALPGGQSKLDTSSHFHVFVGDLAPEIVPETLRAAFAPFGEISNCRIVQDVLTSKHKGYAFVSFFKQTDAANAIRSMNGQQLGSRIIRTNWSIRNPPPPKATNSSFRTITLDDVYNQSSPTNCTVYCGGIMEGLTEDLMKLVFSRFGTIVDIRAFEDKGYAFIKFSTKEAATIAIEAVHQTEINGRQVNCFWGREAGDPCGAAHLAGLPLISTDTPASQHSTSNMNCNQGVNYGYPNAQMQDQHAQGGHDQQAQGGQDQHAQGGQDQHARGAQDQYVQGVQNQFVRGVQDQYVRGVQDQYVRGVQDQYVQGVQDQYVQIALDQYVQGAQAQYVQGTQNQYVQGTQNQYVQSMQNQYVQSTQNQYVQATNFGGPSARSQYIDYNYELANSSTNQMDNETGQTANGQQMSALDDTPAGVYSSQYQSQ